MKRRDLLRWLEQQGCRLLREGGRHSIWHDPTTLRKSAVPRHTEIDERLAKKVCRDLGIEEP